MTPYKQKLDHDPDNGVYGDCYRTAIGCLLDLPPEQVPHFCEPIPNGGEDDWKDVRDLWLAERGLRMVYFMLSSPTEPDEEGRTGLPALLAYMGDLNPGVYYMMSGDTIDDVGHVVICCGGEVVHNPSPREVPIVKPVEGSNHYEFKFLVPLSMDAGAAMGGTSIGQKSWPRPNILAFAMDMEHEQFMRERRRLDRSDDSPLSQLSSTIRQFKELITSVNMGLGPDHNRFMAAHLALTALQLADSIKQEHDTWLKGRKITTGIDRIKMLSGLVLSPDDGGSDPESVSMALTLDEASHVISRRRANQRSRLQLVAQETCKINGHDWNHVVGSVVRCARCNTIEGD